MSSPDPPDLTLYSASISNASARLRIALNLKHLSYKLITINLSKGEQHDPAFRKLNPSGTVPLLIHQHDGSKRKTVIGQSIAALEYLDEAFPNTKPLLPRDPESRAQVRSLTAVLASDTHPLLTHRVSKAIGEMYPGAGADADKISWDKHWVLEGLRKFESLLDHGGLTGSFCVGDEITMADVVLLPEVWFARRIGVDLAGLTRIGGICDRLCELRDVRMEEQTLEQD